MSIQGWYYLHTNGDLIYKPDSDGVVGDFRDSDFVRGFWSLDPTDRAGAWRICVEAMAAGAKPERVKELAAKWQCDDEDAQTYAKHIGASLELDGNSWCAMRATAENIQIDAAGFGDTALEALAALCKDLGYQPTKMWGAKFTDLLEGPKP